MHWNLLAAGLLGATGLVHSVMGERMMLRLLAWLGLQ